MKKFHTIDEKIELLQRDEREIAIYFKNNPYLSG